MNVAAQVIERTSAQPFEQRPGVTELKSRLAAISPQIKARAYTTEKSGRVPAENILALRGMGYFDIVKPRAFGGYEYDFDVLVDLNIELAKVCASTAWVGGLLAAHQWLIASFGEQAQRDVWDANPDAVACGSYAPATKSGCRARRLSADRTLVIRERLRQRAMVAVCSAAAVAHRS